jgi:hypothetical protein
MSSEPSERDREIPEDIKRMAVEIITGLLREEGWELPETNDEEITTRRLERALLEAVDERVDAAREEGQREAHHAWRRWLAGVIDPDELDAAFSMYDPPG